MSEKLETLGDLVEINGAVTNEPPAQDQEPPVALDQDSSNEDQVDTKTEEGAAEDSQSVNEDDASANDGEGEKDIKSQLDEAFDALTEGVKPKNEGQDAQPKDQKQDQIKQPEPKTEPNKPKTEAEEDAEILAMAGNERSRKRFEKLLNERKEAREIAQSFVNQIESAGYDQNTFAQVLEFGRLISSNDRSQKQHAMRMLDQVRANLAAELGEEVPGVDLLAAHPDLLKSVNEMSIDRKHAIEIANARRMANERARAEQMARENQQLRSRVSSAEVQMQQALLSRKDEPYFAEKVNAVHEWLKTGDNMRNFVMSTPPEQWGVKVQQLIDQLPEHFYKNASLTAQAKPRPAQPTPLRSRSMNTGVRDTSKMTVGQVLEDAMRDM